MNCVYSIVSIVCEIVNIGEDGSELRDVESEWNGDEITGVCG